MEGHNRDLMAEFTPEEIILAIKSIGPLKAPGMDGFPAIFYHKFWHIVGEKITKFCLDVLNGERNMEEVNFTNIVLIPKVNSPKQMNQFRPISLCNYLSTDFEKCLIYVSKTPNELFFRLMKFFIHSKKEEGLLKKGLH
ncbi:reverse transcriptase [Gossypium australe]|uniref:Reverse transcriptase n=1 Tax=Gossypium australe TaxID=47621 RepID=A0A5B6WKL4_9ROSI|nr:reverse transcriptase [Gossypium australe]